MVVVSRFAKATIWLTPRRRSADPVRPRGTLPPDGRRAGTARDARRRARSGAGGRGGAGVPRQDARPPPPLRGRQSDGDQAQPPLIGYQGWVAAAPNPFFFYFPLKVDRAFGFNSKLVGRIEGVSYVVIYLKPYRLSCISAQQLPVGGGVSGEGGVSPIIYLPGRQVRGPGRTDAHTNDRHTAPTAG